MAASTPVEVTASLTPQSTSPQPQVKEEDQRLNYSSNNNLTTLKRNSKVNINATAEVKIYDDGGNMYVRVEQKDPKSPPQLEQQQTLNV